jgi:hypothetical protein
MEMCLNALQSTHAKSTKTSGHLLAKTRGERLRQRELQIRAAAEARRGTRHGDVEIPAEVVVLDLGEVADPEPRSLAGLDHRRKPPAELPLVRVVDLEHTVRAERGDCGLDVELRVVDAGGCADR